MRAAMARGEVDLASLLKLLVGIAAVVALTYGGFHQFGMGERIANLLTARANQALVDNDILGATVAIEIAPVRRVAHVSGDLPPAERRQALALVEAVPGIGRAVWDDAATGAH
jgi:hypothetical protein